MLFTISLHAAFYIFMEYRFKVLILKKGMVWES